MDRALERMRWPPVIYQLAHHWRLLPDEIADLPYSAVIDLIYFSEWQSERDRLEAKMAETKAKADAESRKRF